MSTITTDATMVEFLNLNNNHSRPSLNTQNCYSNPTFSHLRRRRPLQKTWLSHFVSPPKPVLVVLPLSVATHALLSPVAALSQDVGAAAFALGGGYGLVSTFDYLTHRNIISKAYTICNIAELLMEIEQKASPYIFRVAFCGFLASFQNSTSSEARYFASLAPLANCLRLIVYGLSLATDEGLIKSVTRERKPEELLRGPLYYVLTLAFCAVVFWRESPVGLLSLAMMCGGDGVADIMGRKFGYAKLPYNQKKSWAGSISMFAFGFLISIGMLYYYSALGYFQLDWNLTTIRVAAVSFIATIVESLPTTEIIDDNISVPLVTLLTAYICFQL